MDKQALQELADDMRTNGVLQPILVRAAGRGKFRIIAGHRRAAAALLAELPAVPAIVKDADDDEAVMMQLSENIHREELSTLDLANAVRRLFDSLGSLDAVAAFVQKSKPWVSKHLSLTCDTASWRARKALEDGITEDLEMVGIIDQVSRISDTAASILVEMIKAPNPISRDEARNYLRQTKATVAINEAEQALKEKQRAERARLKPQVFNPQHALTDLAWGIAHDDKTVQQLLHNFKREELESMERLLRGDFERGEEARKQNTKPGDQWRVLTKRLTEEKESMHLHAWTAGLLAHPFPTLAVFFLNYRAAVHDKPNADAALPAATKK